MRGAADARAAAEKLPKPMPSREPGSSDAPRLSLTRTAVATAACSVVAAIQRAACRTLTRHSSRAANLNGTGTTSSR